MEGKVNGAIFKTDLDIYGVHNSDKDVSAREVINDDRRCVLEIAIRAGAVLKRHRAVEPITVLCTNGEGSFHAGPELDESVDLARGAFIALAPGIDHEVTAKSDMRILVTRFK